MPPASVRPVVSTPLRLTGLLIAVCVAVLLVSFAVSYLVIRNSFDGGLRATLLARMTEYQVIADPADLLERVTEDVAIADPSLTILRFQPDQGPVLSNVDQLPDVQGVTILSEGQISGRRIDDSYLAGAAPVAGGVLTVALTRAQLIDMGEVFATVLMISLLPTLIIAATLGLLFARAARLRIEAISGVLQHLRRGDLTARVALDNGNRDDLAVIGAAVNDMAAAQEAAMSALRQATADIAHDLKTPIQRVAVTLDQMARTSLSDAQSSYLSRAVEETEGMARTFDALLQIAQIEGGVLRDRFVAVDLAEIAAALVDVFSAAAEESGHGLSLQAEGAFVISGDRDLLGQVLANLIENGLRHVPAGGVVAVSLMREGGQVQLRVADNGPGIPEAERGNVLRRLYRLERSRTTPGNGLGLSMVAVICDLHRARLILRDNLPGLAVVITFPAA